jgi:hypothetical protein
VKVLASCDSTYFLEHHKAFYCSAVEAGLEPIINVINPTEEVKFLGDQLTGIDYSYYKNPSKPFLASNRFIIAEEYLKEGLLITDIDCFFNKKIPKISEDIGLFLRENNKFKGMKVAAGILWLSGNLKSRQFISAVRNKLLKRNMEWYVDQVAIYDTYLECRNNISVFKFTNTHMDWEFTENSYMWTGKGNRKYKNQTYLNRKRALEK